MGVRSVGGGVNGFLFVVPLVAFATNSLLYRMALAPDLIDPVTDTAGNSAHTLQKGVRPLFVGRLGLLLV